MRQHAAHSPDQPLPSSVQIVDPHSPNIPKPILDLDSGSSSGNNSVPHSEFGPATDGYSAGPGWDACTGLGSIDGQALLAALQQQSSASVPGQRPDAPHPTPTGSG